MVNEKFYCVIMAGGVGSRFWPVSRAATPKQFLDITGVGRTFLQQTFDRFASIIPVENILVVTSKFYFQIVKDQLPLIPECNILLESYKRNTAPCIAYATAKIATKCPDATIVVAPSDHYIDSVDNFSRMIVSAMDYASGHDKLFTIGVPPTRPETGYGYIQYVRKSEQKVGDYTLYPVKVFTEKPNASLAAVFLSSGEFLWNSGLFVWRLSTINNALRKFLPKIYDAFNNISGVYYTEDEQAIVDKIYESCEAISIDYGVMEKADNTMVFRASFGWSDMGTWEALYCQSRDKDDNGNLIMAEEAMLSHTEDNIIFSDEIGKLVVLKDLSNYMVINTRDVLMVCPRSEEKFKQILADLAVKGKSNFQ
ncbi:MAG: mannose-1-phosphate guanylyltransferase [Bacteroidales bacterium]|nr:mannose-1-phosphate guanylyltransferase [Bacteroidales bacterium]